MNGSSNPTFMIWESKTLLGEGLQKVSFQIIQELLWNRFPVDDLDKSIVPQLMFVIFPPVKAGPSVFYILPKLMALLNIAGKGVCEWR